MYRYIETSCRHYRVDGGCFTAIFFSRHSAASDSKIFTRPFQIYLKASLNHFLDGLQVYSRRDVMVLGKMCLNLHNVSANSNWTRWDTYSGPCSTGFLDRGLAVTNFVNILGVISTTKARWFSKPELPAVHENKHLFSLLVHSAILRLHVRSVLS